MSSLDHNNLINTPLFALVQKHSPLTLMLHCQTLGLLCWQRCLHMIFGGVPRFRSLAHLSPVLLTCLCLFAASQANLLTMDESVCWANHWLNIKHWGKFYLGQPFDRMALYKGDNHTLPSYQNIMMSRTIYTRQVWHMQRFKTVLHKAPSTLTRTALLWV